MDIVKFKTSLGDSQISNEISRPSLFEVIVYRPAVALSFADASLPDILRLRCKSASIPGRAIQSIDFSDYGSPMKIASGALYEPINLEFIMTAISTEHSFFESWQNSIITNARDSVDAIFGDGTSGFFRAADVEYYDKYVTTITIRQFNKFGNTIAEHNLVEAYPISVQATQLNWDDTNSYLRLTVQIQFKQFYTKYFDNGVRIGGLGLLDSISSLGNARSGFVELAKLPTVVATANTLTKTISTINTSLNNIQENVRVVTGAVNEVVRNVQAVTAPAIQLINQTVSTVNNVVTTVNSTINQVKGAINTIENIGDAIRNVNLNGIQSSIESINGLSDAANAAINGVNNAVFSATGTSILIVDSVNDLLTSPFPPA